MLLGEHEHSLDDKNRLTLPAKLRAAFEEGVVLARELDGCLAAYPRAEWEKLVERIAALDPLGEDARRMKRHFFAGASQGELDRQGRLVVPNHAARVRRARARGDGRRGSRPSRDLGPRHLAPSGARA